MRDLTPVGRFVIQPTLIASNVQLPVKTLQDLVSLIKANPDKIKMATAGKGTAGHFAGEMFNAMAGVKPGVMHYNGGGPAIDAVVNGDSQWTVAPIAGRMSYVQNGRLKALAIGGPSRLKLLPDVPTVAESGYPGYEATGWGAIFVPNGTPQPIIDKLNATIATVVTLPEAKRLFEEHASRDDEVVAGGVHATRRCGERTRAQCELRQSFEPGTHALNGDHHAERETNAGRRSHRGLRRRDGCRVSGAHQLSRRE